jgi:MerR family copper efflux transcriptional regulator
MTALQIQDVSRRSGLSGPTLRYYEEVGLIGPIARDPSSGTPALPRGGPRHVAGARMPAGDGHRDRGHTHLPSQPRAWVRQAGEQRDLLLRHAERVEAEIETLRVHLDYLRAKAALWDARDRADTGAEAEANLQVQKMLPRLEEVMLG